MRRIIGLLSAVVLLASCNQYKTTPSGLKYKIQASGNGPTIKQGQVLKFNIEFRLPPKDSVTNSTFGHIPAYIMFDSARVERHSFMEILSQLRAGDKAEFMMSVDTLKKMGGVAPDDRRFRTGDMIKGRIEILQVFATSEQAQADYQKETDLEASREVKAVQDYASKKGLKTQTTPSGALVVITDPGTAPKADSGMHVKMLYRGYTLDGHEFESNMDPRKPNNQPYEVAIGGMQNGGVIRGLDEGLRFFGKGGKGTVIIPAHLAYGAQGTPGIPPYSNLAFDIQLADVMTAPTQAPPPPPVQAPPVQK